MFIRSFTLERNFFLVSGICLVDETAEEAEDFKAPQLAEGIKVAYTVPDKPQSQVRKLA